MAANIKFRIDNKGEVSVEVDGVVGASCQDITRPFEDALGIKVEANTKPAFYAELEGMHTQVGIGE